MITFERANELLAYCPETGGLTRKVRTSNAIKAGDSAGSISVFGYLIVSLDGKPYRAHRVIWLMQHGDWPKHDIDHINGNRADNRLCNLREATRLENTRNCRLSKSNKLKILGVYQFPRTKRFVAEIVVNRKKIHLGYFGNIFDAACARKSAEIANEFHENHGR